MPPNVTILPIKPGSDGDGRRRPSTALGYIRNDDYYLERIATDRWIKDLPGGAQPGMAYKLDRLPTGYASFEKARPNSTHVDRYIWGHPRGQFRSLNEFYPHFKYLMDNSHAYGCPCVLCTKDDAPRKKRPSGGDGERSGRKSVSPVRKSRFFAPPQKPAAVSTHQEQAVPEDRAFDGEGLLQGRPEESPPPKQRRKQVDEEGTIDVYRRYIDRLKQAGPGGSINEPLLENMSPDWRAGHKLLLDTFEEWKTLPSYVPRHGEIVMFVRNLGSHESLGWDKNIQTWRVIDTASKSWLDKPRWEAGVVTQMPTEKIITDDLASTPPDKQNSVVYSGFRIEPMPKPGSVTKTISKQHRYVPLHAIRPFAMWQDCVRGGAEKDRHPTISHALTVTSSFCILDKYHFKGTWPDATVFARAVYLGAELVMIGDTVRLLPRTPEQREDSVTDIMVITSIKLKLVNLDEAGDDDHDDGRPYNTCLHISGKPYTLNSTRSYDGVGKRPITTTTTTTTTSAALLPPGILALGTWYPMLDPKHPHLRLEIPYHRILGRCHELDAIEAWFTAPTHIPPPSSFQAVNATTTTPAIKVNDKGTPKFDPISHGLQSVREARIYSSQNDHRIERKVGGKSWFWADTRVEQLDLHEVNGRFVGVKDEVRGRGQMEEWRRALRAMDGRVGAVEELGVLGREKEVRMAEAMQEDDAGMGSGMLGSVGMVGTEPDGAETEEEEEEEDNEEDAMMVEESQQPPEESEESDVEMEEPEDALAAFKAASRGPAPAPPSMRGIADPISLLDDDSDDE